MQRYIELLKKSVELITQLASETQTMSHKINQQKNDFDSLNTTLNKKREEIAVIEADIRTRSINYERGMDKIKDEIYKSHQEAVQDRETARRELEDAKKTRQLAEEVRKEAENFKNQMASVGSRRVKV